MKRKTRKNIKKWETPIVDCLLKNRKQLVANFHALPIFHINSSVKYFDKFRHIFGEKYFSLETTITNDAFDSFFYPKRCIKKSQDYAAVAFQANETLFTTCGTSVSNRIVVDALINASSFVLLDRECHQSMHFAVKDTSARFDYIYSEAYCEDTGRKYIKIDYILNKIKNEKLQYDVVILNAASYDGIILNVYEIIRQVHAISPKTKFIIDEGWSCAFYFHPDLYKYTAGYAASKLAQLVDIISTQSAHKSLMALRQASLIHSFASTEITQKLYKSRFKHHSTSPNYPILASIDMARAQMQNCGEDLLSEALENADALRHAIATDVLLKNYQHKSNKENLAALSDNTYTHDPLKIHLDIRHLGMGGAALQEYLYHHHGIYINRYTDKTFLINVHVGISWSHIEKLINALKTLAINAKSHHIYQINDDDFIIAYPPGVPLLAPGESINNGTHLAINDKIKSGVSVFQIK